MILGSINDLGAMFGRSEAMKNLYDYLSRALDSNSEVCHRILALDALNSRVERAFDLGSGMRAIEQSYVVGGEAKFESHKKYVDFQLCVKGGEYMRILRNAREICEYNESKDVIFYESNNLYSEIFLDEGKLAILFPSDIHAGGIFANSEVIFKSVVKVPLNLIEPSL